MSPNPFDLLKIPEIIALIFKNLPRKDRINALLVSKHFYSQGLPILWERIALHQCRSSYFLSFPTGEVLERNKHLIREIEFYDAVPLVYLTLQGFSRLKVLDLSKFNVLSIMYIGDNDDDTVDLLFDQIASFISAHSSTLEEIKFCSAGGFPYIPNVAFWNALAKCTSLKEVRLVDTHVRDLYREFFNVCNIPRSIHFQDVTLPEWGPAMLAIDRDLNGSGNLAGNFILSAPQSISMESCPLEPSTSNPDRHDQAMFIRSCVNLESLVWNTGDFEAVIDDETGEDVDANLFAQTLVMEPWPFMRLSSLNFSHVLMGDSHLANILNRIQHLQELRVGGTFFGDLSMSALFDSRNGAQGRLGSNMEVSQQYRHADTIEILALTSCVNVTSVMLQRVLSGCRRLKLFIADTIEASDIVNGDPWVCRDIESLFIYITTTNSKKHLVSLPPADLQRAVYSQLSVLTKLKALNITNTGEKLPTQRALAISRKLGLDLLIDLKDLTTFIFNMDSNQEMTEKDLRWMLSNWTKLTNLFGRFNQIPKIQNELENMIKEHNANNFRQIKYSPGS